MQYKLLVLSALCFVSISFAQEKKTKFSLQEAIDYALQNNYNAKTAANNIEAAKQKKWETTTIGLPQVSAKVDYQNWLKQQVSLLPGEITGGAPGTYVPVTFGTKQNINAAITLNQLIFDGSYLVGLQSAKTYLKISELANEKTALSIREAVINAYGNVLVADKSIEIFKKNMLVLEKNLEDAKKIFQNGFNEEEDVEQLQITYSTVKSQLDKTKRLRDIGLKMLNISMGNNLESPLSLTDTLEEVMNANIDLNLLSKTFNIEEHIDYKIAENDKTSKALLVKLEKSKALPSLTAFVNYGYTGNAEDFSFFNSSQEWYNSSLLGVSLNIPIFSSFQRRSRTQQATIELDNADLKLDQIKEELNLGVASAKSDYTFSVENYGTAKKNLELAQRIEKKQQIKFFEGVGSSFDLSQAQNQLYTQQQNYIQSMLDVIAKKAALENALNIPIKK
ncbi:transporter [Polaribacter pacificus]|uniref:Transporter n=1 Tax=Polaribacter pacificus TaxID=1775173 RepID=A0A917MCA9_9FLAO|nr:TolC family protein [Polaribacter pacificus]GGG94628.1 transporter [Polaribacter pacificus]